MVPRSHQLSFLLFTLKSNYDHKCEVHPFEILKIEKKKDVDVVGRGQLEEELDMAPGLVVNRGRLFIRVSLPQLFCEQVFHQ